MRTRLTRSITFIHIRRPAYWLTLSLEFKLQDVWVGVYWRSLWNMGFESCSVSQHDRWEERVTFDLYVCIIPCLPLHLGWRHIHKEHRR